ncbi:MAG: hypothetical protein ACYCS7_02395 [Acidimicrobiales bacterium]
MAVTHYPTSAAQFATWFTDEARSATYIEAGRFRHGLAWFRCRVLAGERTLWLENLWLENLWLRGVPHGIYCVIAIPTRQLHQLIDNP